MPETMCPECGFGPVGEESCPECGALFERLAPAHLRFDDRPIDPFADLEEEAKTAADIQLPDSVTLSPWAATATFAVAGLAFGAEALGLVGDGREALPLGAVAVANLFLAVGIALRLGFARALATMLLPVQAGLILWAGRVEVGHAGVVAGAIFPAVALFGMSFDPGLARRAGALALTVGLLGFRAWQMNAAPPVDPVEAAQRQLVALGVQFELPPGYQAVAGKAARRLMALPEARPGVALLAFTKGGSAEGFLVAEPAPRGERSPDPSGVTLSEVLRPLDLVGREPVELFPGDFAGVSEHRGVKLRLVHRERDLQGLVLAAAAPDGRRVAVALFVPSTAARLLRPEAAELFSRVKFLRETE